jgi:hypothetical protein
MNIIPIRSPPATSVLPALSPGHSEPVLAVFLLAAGSLAVSYDGCQAVEWSCNTGAELRRFELPGLLSLSPELQ